MTADVDIPFAQSTCGQGHSQCAPMPVFVENGIIFGLRHNGTIAKAAAHIVNAAHGALANPVPIMLSRVIRSINAASSIPSVPMGRWGRTK